MRLTEVFPSKYLRAGDIPGGRRVTVTISHCGMEEVGKDKDSKLVISFTGKDKGMILNKTNAQVIADAYGEDTDAWLGRAIVLFAATTSFAGKIVPCLRVEIPMNAMKPSPAAPVTSSISDAPAFEEADIPF